MTGRSDEIGFSQRVRLEWFKQTANLVLAGNSRAAVTDVLRELLKDRVSVSSQAERGNREKIITILLKTLVAVPRELEPLRDEGFGLLRRIPERDHLAVYWGMVSAVYPFWSSVAVQVGRLLRLQGAVAAVHVQRRVRELYGERETVSRAARRVLRSYLDWGVLRDSGTKGVYQPEAPLTIADPHLTAWLVEAAFRSSGDTVAPLKDVLNSASLFPFQVKPVTAANIVAASGRLDVCRHGLDDDLLILRATKPSTGHEQLTLL